jgi:hypothetical protein
MRGGAQSHLMRCDDGNYYVVKFRNNPQHHRVLANDYLASKLAHHVGLPVPAVELIEVTDRLIANNSNLTIMLGHRQVSCEPGLQFGSRYAIRPWEGQVFDYLPSEVFSRVRNLHAFAGILALDKWTCNSDGRQVAFCRRARERKFTAVFIDQGYCFNGGDWTFPDFPLQGVFPKNEVYGWVTGWDSFDPWLTRIEAVKDEIVWEAAGQIPPEWYGSEWGEVQRLVEQLLERRHTVRDLILSFRHSPRRPFPGWIDAA